MVVGNITYLFEMEYIYFNITTDKKVYNIYKPNQKKMK